jgi:hypothetical protein
MLNSSFNPPAIPESTSQVGNELGGSYPEGRRYLFMYILFLAITRHSYLQRNRHCECQAGKGPVVVIDNYDSFTYNLCQVSLSEW